MRVPRTEQTLQPLGVPGALSLNLVALDLVALVAKCLLAALLAVSTTL